MSSYVLLYRKIFEGCQEMCVRVFFDVASAAKTSIFYKSNSLIFRLADFKHLLNLTKRCELLVFMVVAVSSF